MKWYFGNYAALNFMTTPPSLIAGSAMSVLEGCSSIADAATGNLLFYTDGQTIWNQTNVQMANGTGLSGSVTPSQSSIIMCPMRLHLTMITATISFMPSPMA